MKNTGVPTHGGGSSKVTRLYASKTVEKVGSDEEKGEPFKPFNDSDQEDEPCLGDKDDPYLMGSEERREWRNKIRQVLDTNPDVEEELDPIERTKKVQQLLANYPLVVEEDDPEWPDDADGRGFKLDQFFDKITIKNNTARKDDNDNDDSDNEIVWQDDNYIRPIKDVVTAEWEETVFKDISPLIILVHNRYKRFAFPFSSSFLFISCYVTLSLLTFMISAPYFQIIVLYYKVRIFKEASNQPMVVDII